MRRIGHPAPGYRAKFDNWIGINLLLGFVTIAIGLFGMLFFNVANTLDGCWRARRCLQSTNHQL